MRSGPATAAGSAAAMAAVTSFMRRPKRGPRALKLGFTVATVRPPTSAASRTCFTFNSSSSCARITGRRACSFSLSRSTTSSASGWRTRRAAAARAERPRRASRIARPVAADSSSSISAASASGQSHRCTLGGAPGTRSATRLRWIASEMNGANGASNLTSVVRHSYRVW